MRVIVRDDGFHQEDWTGGFAPAGEPRGGAALDLPPEADPDVVELDGIAMIRIGFPNFADGRGFTIARQLRRRGFAGRLRAAGHVLSDQYAMARRAGFDEVEIDEALSRRQPESHWHARSDWQANDYQSMLRGPRPESNGNKQKDENGPQGPRRKT